MPDVHCRRAPNLFIYAKNEFDFIAGHKLKELKDATKKTLTDEELSLWEASRDMAELEQSIREVNAGQYVEVAVSPVAATRAQTGLSQMDFARLLGVSVRTLQQWEQGRRQPSGAAKTLLAIAEKRPEVLREVAA